MQIPCGHDVKPIKAGKKSLGIRKIAVIPCLAAGVQVLFALGHSGIDGFTGFGSASRQIFSAD